MTSKEQKLSAFKKDLTRIVRKHYPDWTDYNAHDPGITVLELFAYIIDDLAYRRRVKKRKKK